MEDAAVRGPSSTSDPSSVRVVLVTVPDVEMGVRIAEGAVRAGLAACGNVVPGLTSIYRWKGEIHRDPESLIIFKTTRGVLEELKKKVLELHPYEVPEFLALSTTGGHLPYLNWVEGEVSDRGRS